MTTLTLSQQYEQRDIIERWQRADDFQFTEVDLTCDYCGKAFKGNYRRKGNRNNYCSRECHTAGATINININRIKMGHNYRAGGYFILKDTTPDDEYGNSAKYSRGAYLTDKDIDKLRREGLLHPGTRLKKENTGVEYEVVEGLYKGKRCLKLEVVK